MLIQGNIRIWKLVNSLLIVTMEHSAENFNSYESTCNAKTNKDLNPEDNTGG